MLTAREHQPRGQDPFQDAKLPFVCGEAIFRVSARLSMLDDMTAFAKGKFVGIRYWCISGLGTANVGLTCVEAGLHAGTPDLGNRDLNGACNTDLFRGAALQTKLWYVA